MQHDEDRERDLHDEEDDVEDDQHEGCSSKTRWNILGMKATLALAPAGPPDPGVGWQQAGLDLLSLFQGSQQKSIEYRD